jgi:hyperosmotically inducible periplasmic protein
MNFAKFLAASMAAVALALSACASRDEDPARRSAGEFSSDAALTAKVKTAIAKDAGLGSAAAVNVNSYRGVVQLSGFVDSQDKIQRAEEVARSVQGVQRVENDVKVKPAS